MGKGNVVQFEVTGDYALFSNPVMRVGGEKCSYQIPTYEALKGIISSVYFKPTLIWYIDKVRVMNKIQTQVKGMAPLSARKGRDIAYYTYLKDVKYQVQAHFEWNMNRPELAQDRNENKHYAIAKRMIERGGRRDIFLGTRECQGYVAPCKFGTGVGAYDDVPELSFGLMYNGMTYADEAYSDETKGMMSVRMWRPVMKNGVIEFERPEDCKLVKPIHAMPIKPFGKNNENFVGAAEFPDDIVEKEG